MCLQYLKDETNERYCIVIRGSWYKNKEITENLGKVGKITGYGTNCAIYYTMADGNKDIHTWHELQPIDKETIPEVLRKRLKEI